MPLSQLHTLRSDIPQTYVQQFTLVYCLTTLSVSAYFTPQDFNLKVAVIVNTLLFLIGAPYWFRKTRASNYSLNLLSQLGNAGASVWICSFLGPSSHINLVAIPQFILALMMFSGGHPKTTTFTGGLCLFQLSLPLFPFVDSWYLHKRMKEEGLVILREIMDVLIFALSTYQFKIINEAWKQALSQTEREKKNYLHQSEWRQKLLHILSHDIKEPVVHSLVALRRLKRTGSGEQLELIESTESAQQAIKEMITNVEVSNAETLSMERPTEAMDARWVTPNEVIQRLLPWFESRLREKEILLDTSEVNELDRIYAQPDVLTYQIFLNILSNAVKFTQPKGIITIKTSRSPEGVASWSIHNPDRAISEDAFDKTPKIYTGTQGERGSGLGIGIAKSFAIKNRIELHWASPQLKPIPSVIEIPPEGTTVFLIQSPPNEALIQNP